MPRGTLIIEKKMIHSLISGDGGPWNGDRLLTAEQVSAITSLSRREITRQEKRGRFPRHVKIGALRVAWLSSEVDAWLRDLLAARGLVS